MPIYEYVCRDCSHHFETLVSGRIQPECPSCHGAHLDKKFSVFAVSDGSSRAQEAACGACHAQGGCSDPGSGVCHRN